MPNRLATSLSPYLRQHQENPVDWYEWGAEAFELASRLDRPVFLSVGYSSCHWCHVMAHESFEDSEVAQVLNQRFVSIKLDREERPDVDDAYMTAVQVATGRGGWPMTCFLTPQKQPFFAGTYFPKEDRGPYPGFLTLLLSIDHAWKTQRAELVSSAASLADHLASALSRSHLAPVELSPALFEASVQHAHEEFDHENGGMGTAPKFPPHTALAFLEAFSASPFGPQSYREMAREMVLTTLESMAKGGIHDHVAGGFHRYSTDERWLLPHFEKMLYDNAQLLGAYSRAARRWPDDPRTRGFRSVATRLVEWLETEMTGPEGLFYSALDADSEGEEGRHVVWSCAEIRSLLGDRAEAFLTAYQAREAGNYLDEATRKLTGHNVLHLAEWTEEFAPELAQLHAARKRRPQPLTDDKAIASWNGMMIAALVDFGDLERAEACAQTWHQAISELGYVPRHLTRGQASGLGFLDDVAHLADGFFALATTTQKPEWRARAEDLTARMIDLFEDPAGGFFFTSTQHETLFGRTKPPTDGACPCPNGVALRCLRLQGETDRYRRGLAAFSGWMARFPGATESLLLEAMIDLSDR